jgi:aromatic ring-opening dioxygenase catalytic subunit (LigB family)
MDRLPTLYIPHGGGPCFFMDVQPGLPPDLWDSMAAYLRGIDASLGVRPKAVLLISGHWEEARPTVNSASRPPLLFDYYGFPEHTYQLTYPAPGSPEIAERVRAVLSQCPSCIFRCMKASMPART